MSILKVNGVVLRRTNVGDNDVILTIFTSELGIVKASAKGVKSMKSKLAAGTGLFAYSELILFKGKELYRVNSCTLKDSFYNLSTNIERIAFATYLADITSFVGLENMNNESLLKLLLNTFYLLANSDKNLRLIKCVYELKLLYYIGFAPRLEGCVSCGDVDKIEYFSPNSGGLICSSCRNKHSDIMNLSEPCLIAMRFILYHDDKKAFAFQLSDLHIDELENHIQGFIKEHIQKDFYSLSYLNTLLGK